MLTGLLVHNNPVNAIDPYDHTGYAQVIEEWTIDGSSMFKTSYVPGDDVISQSKSDWTWNETNEDWEFYSDDDTQYLLYDGHGSTRQLADPIQTIDESYDYYAYGVMLSDTSASGADTAASHLDELHKLYGLSPLREQVKGKEKLFLSANLCVLKKFKWYLENYDPKKLGTGGSPGFFREPCSVAQVALMLAKKVAPQRYAKIEPAITSIRWAEEQKVQDLSSFVNLVLISLDEFVSYEESTILVDTE